MKYFFSKLSFSRYTFSAIFFLLFVNNVFPQWTNITSPSKYQFQSIDFPSSSIGYLGGAEGTFKSIDGGNSWNKIKYLRPTYTYSDSLLLEGINEQYIHFINDSVGIIAGWNAWNNNEIINNN